jgi:HAD superfamily hydrolase (TIGR01509 family)
MLRAIIFDFDGVIADSEPAHFAAFQNILGEIGIPLTEEDYYSHYLGYDDRGCFAAALTAHDRPAPSSVVEDLAMRKARVYLDHIKQHLVIFPGVQDLVREATARYPLAIASGALRHEIELILDHADLRKAFAHITSAEDVTHGKPHPESYLHALAALNRIRPSGLHTLAAQNCLVIEDSIPGIQAAQAAGMKVLAVANTHTRRDLHGAEAVTQTLQGLNLSELENRLWGQAPGEYD